MRIPRPFSILLAASAGTIVALCTVDAAIVGTRGAGFLGETLTSDMPNLASTPEAPLFRFASIERGALEQTITVTGTLQPVKTVEVGSQVSGQISKVYVDFNDTVVTGQPLAEIDQRTFKAKVDEAEAVLGGAMALVKIEEAKLDRATADLANARAQKDILAARLASADALMESARRNVERKTSLQAHSFAPATMVDDAQTDLASKTAAEREARKMLDLNSFVVLGAEADVRRLEAELIQAKAAVPEKQAALRAGKADLDRTIIRSPMDGVIVGRFVNEGQTLAVGLEARTAFSVAHRLEDMEIYARVDETDIGKMVPGQRAHFTVDAYSDRRFEAVVRQVRKAPQVNQNVVTYTVVLSTSNPSGLLLPGMTALVRIITDRHENVLKVPVAALRFRPQGERLEQGASMIWVRSGSGLKRIPITIASVGGEQAAVAGDVSEGDQVAIGQVVRPHRSELFGIRFGS